LAPVAVPFVALLAALALRRLVLLCAALLPPRRRQPADPVPVAVLAAARNEDSRLPILLKALSELDYPRSLLTILLADDASTDSTPDLLDAFAAGRPHVRIVRLASQRGKAGALNELLSIACGIPFVAIYDAKHAPEPGSLRSLAGALADTSVGAAWGYLDPSNAGASLVSRYSAMETWVTQLLNHAGKDRLAGEAPTLGGNCMYRRRALDESGGFPDGAYSEDTEVSLAMISRGWKTRFVPEARAANLLPVSFSEWWRQRVRWTVGLQRAKPRASSSPESWATALGYFDRIVLLCAIALVLARKLEVAWLLIWAVPVLLTIPAALFKAGRLMQVLQFAFAAMVMFPFDVAVTLWSTLRGALRRAVAWR